MKRSTGFGSLLLAIVIRPLARERSRSLLTVAGVAVGISVLVAIQLANQSALRSFEESVDAIAGRANYQIVGDGAPVDESVLLGLQPFWEKGVRFAPVIDTDGAISPSGVPLRLLGVDLFSDLQFRDYRYARIVTDRNQERAGESVSSFLTLFRNDSVVLPAAFARREGVDLNDRITITINGRTARLIVRGILESEGPATAFNGSLAIVDIATAQTNFALEGEISHVDLIIPEDEALVREIAGSLPDGLRLERPSRRSERVGKMLTAFRVNLFALSAVALLVGVFLVYNTILVSILRRKSQIGILKTVGVTAREIFAAFVLEGALLGLVGSILGVVLGYVLAWSALGMIERTINALYVATSPSSIDLSVSIVSYALATGTLISILSAIQPAAEAADTPSIALIREGTQERVAGRRTWMLGAMALVCFVAAAISSRMPPIGNVSVGGYLAVVLCIAGFSILSPIVLRGVAAALRPMMRRWLSFMGDLASGSLPTSLRRTAIAAAALAIAIAMMVAVSLMIGSFRVTVETWVRQTVQSDIWLRPTRTLSNAGATAFPSEIAGALREIDFVEAFDRFRGRDLVFRDQPIFVGSGDFPAMLSHGDLPMVRPGSMRKAIEDALARDGVVVSESFALRFDLDIGDTIDLPTAKGMASFPLCGIYRDYSTDRGIVVMNRPLYVERYDDDAINTVAIFLREGVDPDLARSELERILGARFGAFAFTNATIRTEVMRIFDQTFLITWALLVVALVVAVLGIINTQSALLLERRREIALLRVTGMTRQEIRVVTVLESLIIGIASTLLGTLCGWLLSTILIFVINKQSFGWTIEFNPPYGLIVASLATTFVATLVSGFVSSRFAERLDLLAELSGE